MDVYFVFKRKAKTKRGVKKIIHNLENDVRRQCTYVHGSAWTFVNWWG